MNVSMKSLLACAIILTIGHQTVRAEYDVNAYCTLVANGVKLASVDDCQTFYTCMNGVGTKGECPSTQAFDKNTQNCRPKSDVKCYYGMDEPCLGQAESFVPVVNTCNGYIYCKNSAEVGRGQCPKGQIFHNGACVYGNCNDNINTGTTNTGLSSVCQIMPENRFFGSTKNCKIWQVCQASGLKQGNCDNNFVFDVNNGNCNYETGNMCSRVTGQEIQPDPTPSAACSASQKDEKKADISKCSSYQVCDGTYWIQTPCATGMYYSVPEGKCMARQEATPTPECNRCEFTKRQFVNAVDPTCRKYLVCSNGYATGTGNCAADSYFNEGNQACVLDRNGLTNYAATNGACKNTGGVDPECADTCAPLSGADCKETGDCECGLTGTTCGVCANGYETGTNNCKPEGGNEDCPDICTGLTDCKPTDDCKCGTTGGVCGVCGDTETVDPTSFECTECEAYCTGLAAADCKANEDCDCGLGLTDECSLCAEGVDENGDCILDCNEVCGEFEEAADCVDTNNCTCGLHNGVCVDCGDDECNTCVCAGADPACVDGEVCECYTDGTSCFSCPTGVNETGDGCNP